MVALFVILFIIVALTVDLVVQARQKKNAAPAAAMEIGRSVVKETLRVPQGLFFHPGHSWARLISGQKIEVGIDDFLQKSIGKIERVLLPAVGTVVKQGEPIFTLEKGGRSLHVVAPVSGRISTLNADILNNTELIHNNPYMEGWFCTIEPEQLATNLSLLTIAERSVEWIRNEVVRFREFVLGQYAQPEAIGATMFDGGVPVAGSLDHMDEESWKKFDTQFLQS
jgi:glycine cleavage system H lipoate-binding protein